MNREMKTCYGFARREKLHSFWHALNSLKAGFAIRRRAWPERSWIHVAEVSANSVSVGRTYFQITHWDDEEESNLWAPEINDLESDDWEIFDQKPPEPGEEEPRRAKPEEYPRFEQTPPMLRKTAESFEENQGVIDALTEQSTYASERENATTRKEPDVVKAGLGFQEAMLHSICHYVARDAWHYGRFVNTPFESDTESLRYPSRWCFDGFNPSYANYSPSRHDIIANDWKVYKSEFKVAGRTTFMGSDSNGWTEPNRTIGEELSSPQRVNDIERPKEDKEMTGMSFEAALGEIKAGRHLRRKDWNEDFFVFLIPGSHFDCDREPLRAILGEGSPVTYGGHIAICLGLNEHERHQVEEWKPNNQDLLRDDWEIKWPGSANQQEQAA